jgi:hypothetical protein
MLICCCICVILGMVIEHKVQIGNRLLALRKAVVNPSQNSPQV